jgi:hypothetical protein
MFIIPALCIFAGLSMKRMIEELVSIEYSFYKFIPFLIIFLVLISIVFRADSYSQFDYDTREIVEYIKNNTEPNDYIFTEEPMLVYLSERLIPNSAINWNGAGIIRGLNSEQVINDVTEYDPKMVLLVIRTDFGKNKPRIYSTFNETCSNTILDYLDNNYDNYFETKRNYQTVGVWEK